MPKDPAATDNDPGYRGYLAAGMRERTGKALERDVQARSAATRAPRKFGSGPPLPAPPDPDAPGPARKIGGIPGGAALAHKLTRNLSRKAARGPRRSSR